MNDNLKNFSEQPDPKVWEAVKKAERKSCLRRQLMSGVIGGLLVASAIVATLFLPSAQLEKPVALESQQPVVIPQASAQESAVEEVSVAPASEPVVSHQPKAEPTPSVAEVVQLDVPTEKSPKAEPVAPRRVVSSVQVSRVSSALAENTNVVAEVKVADRGVEEALKATVEQEKKQAAKAGSSTNVPDTIIWIPNAFAPASDNPDVRTFRARLNRHDASISNFKMVIYNRAGHQVFSSMDINTEWDGTYRGTRLPQGAYVYVLHYTDADGFQHQRKGSVSLIR